MYLCAHCISNYKGGVFLKSPQLLDKQLFNQLVNKRDVNSEVNRRVTGPVWPSAVENDVWTVKHHPR